MIMDRDGPDIKLNEHLTIGYPEVDWIPISGCSDSRSTSDTEFAGYWI